MSDHTPDSDFTEPQEAWVTLGPIDRYGDPSRLVPCCGIPSPTGVMLCILPATTYPHWADQHLGIDRHGNFRGWPDRRATVSAPNGSVTS